MKVASIVLSTLLTRSTLAQADNPSAEWQLDSASALPVAQATPTPSSPYYESVWAKVSAGINTECKTCPYTLCSNKNFYGSLLMFRATCWATGQRINSTDMWLQSEEGCYVTVQDTLKYWRNYTQDLKSCGEVPQKVSPRRMTIRAATDCKRCPNDQCETVKSYGRRNEVPVTCRAQSLPNCLGNCVPSDIPPVNASTVFPWYKTNANCYIRANSITTRRKRQSQSRPLEDCGPVPFLENSFRVPPVPPPSPVTVTVTVTIIQPTTIIIRPNPCPACAPLIWGYTPPAAASYLSSSTLLPSSANVFATLVGDGTLDGGPLVISDPPPLTSTSTIGVTLTPTSLPGTTIKPTTTPIITISPTSTTVTTLTSTTSPVITLTPTSTTVITISPTSTSGPTFSSNLTLSLPPTSPGTIITIPPTTSDTPINITGTPITPPTFSSNLTLAPITLSGSQTTSSILTNSNPSSNLSPSSSTNTTSIGTTIVLTTNPGITLTPTNSPGTTFTPTSNPGVTITPTNDPGTIITGTPITPITISETLTLPPITLLSIVTPVIREYVHANATKPPKCTCAPYPCSGGAEAQKMCSTIASEHCTKTCSSGSSATMAEPFQPLMSEGGRPPPGDLAMSSPETYVNGKVDEECRCAPMVCPENGDEAMACAQIWTAACSMDCGRGTPATKVVYGGSTVLIITQLIGPTEKAVL